MKKIKRASFFTLIELLVVIAIIAILAAILLPALNSARERGVSTDCVSRLKGVGQALGMYRSEFNDTLFSPNTRTNSATQWSWVIALMKGGYITKGLTHRDAEPFMCPAAQAVTGVHLSYAYGILSYLNKSDTDPAILNFKRPSVQKMGESKVLLVSDSGRGVSGEADTLIYNLNHSSYGLAYTRHSGRLNGLLLDAHVESVTADEVFAKFGYFNGKSVNTIPNVREGKVGATTVRSSRHKGIYDEFGNYKL